MPPRQIPLDLALPARLTRDDLVVSASNAAAVSLIDRWPEWPGPVAVIVGPPGSGKSHLAAIWSAISGAARVDLSVQIPESGHAVLLEDADAGPIDETMLFHLINSVRAEGGHLLITARQQPSIWRVSLPDLASRMRAATLAEIGEPDDALLEGVLTKLFADRQVTVEPNVIAFLLRRMERSLATAIDVVDRLDRAALEQNTRITRALASTVLDDADRGQGQLDF